MVTTCDGMMHCTICYGRGIDLRRAEASAFVDAAAVLLLGRVAHRGDVAEMRNLNAIGEACRQWREVVSADLAKLRALRSFAPTAELFSAERMHGVLTDANALERWEAEAQHVLPRFESELAALDDAQPTQPDASRS